MKIIIFFFCAAGALAPNTSSVAAQDHPNYNPYSYNPMIKEHALYGNPSRRSYPHGHNDGNDNRSSKSTSNFDPNWKRPAKKTCAGLGCTGKFSRSHR